MYVCLFVIHFSTGRNYSLQLGVSYVANDVMLAGILNWQVLTLPDIIDQGHQ